MSKGSLSGPRLLPKSTRAAGLNTPEPRLLPKSTALNTPQPLTFKVPNAPSTWSENRVEAIE
jgi:hypothetical protein